MCRTCAVVESSDYPKCPYVVCLNFGLDPSTCDPNPGGESSELAAAETEPQAVETATEPQAVETETEPQAVETETEPQAVETETEPQAVETETEPQAVETDETSARGGGGPRQTGTSRSVTPLSPKPTLPALPDPRGWAFPSPIRRCARDPSSPPSFATRANTFALVSRTSPRPAVVSVPAFAWRPVKRFAR